MKQQRKWRYNKFKVMNKPRYFTYILLLNFVLCSLSFALSSKDMRDKIIPHLDLRNIDVRNAIDIIFKDTDASYTVDGGVQGKITVKAEQKPFETVLRNILNQIGASYRIQQGIYEIVMRKRLSVSRFQPDDPVMPIPGVDGVGIYRIPIRHADPALVVKLLSEGSFDWKIGSEISLLNLTASIAPSGGGFNSGIGGSRRSSGFGTN